MKMNEKKKFKNKNLFSQRSWSIMGYVVAEEYSKKNYKKLFCFEHFLIFYLLYICIIFWR